MPRPLVMPLILKKKREMNRKKSQGTLPPQGLSSRWHHDYQPAEDSASSQQQLEQRQLQLRVQGLSSRWHHDYQPAEDSASSQQQLEQRQLQLRVQGLSSRWHHDYQPAEDSASSQQQLEQRQLQLRVQASPYLSLHLSLSVKAAAQVGLTEG
ncbi:uncharacterized protein LOC121881008 isoform X7 [Thunnus maccoyii]|uniref:uncharacterized protein LOC121881008 isoform X7 n=1 Tax=Thunnus maccoyii TaxID=8240 RepID=UPI001C4D4DF4|nr:uncharacterized protein LOC121881008 isoform X7 [Thunnus maccoyii]